MRRYWTDARRAKMAELIARKATLAEVQAAFPDRTYEGLKLAARSIGLRLSVTCKCGRVGSLKDNLCTVCRSESALAAYRESVRYPWRQEWDLDILRLRNCRTRNEWSAMLRRISTATNVPISSVKTHCARLNVFLFRHENPKRAWSAEDDALVSEMASQRSLKHIANRLHRSIGAISNRIHLLGLSQRVTEGYSQKDLVEVFGVHSCTVRKWAANGWLGDRTDWNREFYRVPEEAVREFLFARPEQYDLRRVDDAWFKGMIFPKFSVLPRRTTSISQGATT